MRRPPPEPRRPSQRPPPPPAAAAALPLFVLVIGFLLALLPISTTAFQLPHHALASCGGTRGVVIVGHPRPRTVSRRWFTPPQQQQQPQQEDEMTDPLASSSLPALPSTSPQYEQLMETLSDDEKYNILVQSRAASLIEVLGPGRSSASSSTPVQTDFEAVYKLIEEMTGKDVRLTTKSFASLVDAASLSRDLGVIQQCLLLARRNGVSRVFAKGVATLNPPPRLSEAAVESLPTVPQDDRTLELGAGLAALAVVGGALSVEAFGPLLHVDTGPASLLLFVTFVVGVLDFTQRQGQELRLVLTGLNRMFMRDPEREARVQAATFLSAYLLGLPCFCFSPNVLETIRMAAEVPEFQDVLSSTTGLNRLLVYLLAPVAAEEANHVQLIVSDPRQARALLQVFKERSPSQDEMEGGEERGRSLEEVLLPWAYQEARRLLAANSGLLEKLRQRMESGGATAGDCCSLLESSLAGGGENNR